MDIFIPSLIAGYFAVHVTLALAVRPYRVRLQAMSNEMLQEQLAPDEREFVEYLVSSVYSWRSSIVLSLTYMIGLFQTGDGLDREYEQFKKDFPMLLANKKIHDLVECHFASSIASNPVFGLTAILLKSAFRAKMRLHRDAKEASIMTDVVGLTNPI